MPVFISKSLSTAEQVQMRKLLKKCHEISYNENIAKNELRIQLLKLFHGPKEKKIDWLQTTNLLELTIVQSLISAQQRHKLDHYLHQTQLVLIFVSENLLYNDIKDDELFKHSNYRLIGRNDRKSGEHSGIFVAIDTPA